MLNRILDRLALLLALILVVSILVGAFRVAVEIAGTKPAILALLGAVAFGFVLSRLTRKGFMQC